MVPTYEDLALPACQGDTESGNASYVTAAISIVVVAVLWVAGQDQLLRIAIPVVAMLTGVALYFSRPIIYIQYTLWVWFLSPLVRRLVDWRFGYADPNLVLVAPLLVSAVAGLTLILPSRRTNTRIPGAFALCGTAILYGFVVGMFLHSSAETVYGLCNWLCPMLFGLHVFLNWRRYEEHSAAISKTFLWAVLILGLYGVYQYFSPSAWDLYWLESTMKGSGGEAFGRPEALQVRVWSTMNSPGPFANTMVTGLLLLFVIRSSLKLPALVAGYLSLLLSLVRTSWLGWFVGLFVLLRKSKPRVIVRVLALLMLLAVCLVPLLNDPRLANVLGDRVGTLSDVSHDESFGDRLSMYRILTMEVIDHPFGNGVSNQKSSQDIAIDSGILAMFLALGWLGGILFAAGVASLLVKGRAALRDVDEHMTAYRAVIIALLAQIIGGNVFVGVNGAIFWVFAGTYLAGLCRDPIARLETLPVIARP